MFLFAKSLNREDRLDIMKTEREKSLHKIHKFIDNKSTERVVDFLIQKKVI